MKKKQYCSPPLTTLTLHVGITGDASYSDEQDFDSLRQKIRKTLADIQSVITEIHAESAPYFTNNIPILRLISMPACKIDYLSAMEADGLNYELQFVLPYKRGYYESAEGKEPSATSYKKLFAKSTAILEMPQPKEAGQEALLAAGSIVLNHIDILLAATDRNKTESNCICTEMIKEAVAHEVPIIWLDERGQSELTLGHHESDGTFQALLKEKLTEIVSPAAFEQESKGTNSSSLIHRYFSERERHWTFGLPYRVITDLLLFRNPRLRIRMDAFEKSTEKQWKRAWTESPDLPKSQTEHITTSFCSHYAWADNLAVYYANLYRTSFILRYLFSFVAVLGIALGFYGSKELQHVGFLIQVLVLAGIIVFIKFGNYRGWHERFIDYRYLAELIRHMRYMPLIGGITPASRYPVYNANSSSLWVNWHFRSIVREAGLISASIDGTHLSAFRSFLQKHEIKEQRQFYSKNTKDFATIASRLEALGMILFYLGLLAIIGRFAIFAMNMDPYKTLFNEISLLLPALAPVFFGIRSQGEFPRLSQRYAAMAEQLSHIGKQLEEPEQLSFQKINRLATDAAFIMISEVSDWRVLLKTRTLSIF